MPGRAESSRANSSGCTVLGFVKRRRHNRRAGRLGKAGATMEYRNLGRSGLKVSPICLGTMMFGGPTDEATAARIVASAARRGHQLHRHRRRIHRRPLGGDHRPRHQGEARLAGCSRPRSPTRPARGRTAGACRAAGSCRPARRACAASAPTTSTSTTCTRRTTARRSAETVRAMADLMRAGKIRYFGVSNYRAWRVAEICRICDELGIDRPVVSASPTTTP